MRDHVPLFVTATLTINVGVLFQPSADRRAIEARRAWAAAQIEGPVDRASQATTKLAAARAEARTRLEWTTALATSLEQRHKTLEAIGTDAARVAASNGSRSFMPMPNGRSSAPSSSSWIRRSRERND